MSILKRLAQLEKASGTSAYRVMILHAEGDTYWHTPPAARWDAVDYRTDLDGSPANATIYTRADIDRMESEGVTIILIRTASDFFKGGENEVITG